MREKAGDERHRRMLPFNRLFFKQLKVELQLPQAGDAKAILIMAFYKSLLCCC